jgi:DNA-binding MarR family transcriptional regulator
MSQGDILNILEKEKEPLSAQEIKEKSNLSIASVVRNIKSLCKHNEIDVFTVKIKGFVTHRKYWRKDES